MTCRSGGPGAGAGHAQRVLQPAHAVGDALLQAARPCAGQLRAAMGARPPRAVRPLCLPDPDCTVIQRQVPLGHSPLGRHPECLTTVCLGAHVTCQSACDRVVLAIFPTGRIWHLWRGLPPPPVWQQQQGGGTTPHHLPRCSSPVFNSESHTMQVWQHNRRHGVV